MKDLLGVEREKIINMQKQRNMHCKMCSCYWCKLLCLCYCGTDFFLFLSTFMSSWAPAAWTILAVLMLTLLSFQSLWLYFLDRWCCFVLCSLDQPVFCHMRRPSMQGNRYLQCTQWNLMCVQGELLIISLFLDQNDVCSKNIMLELVCVPYGKCLE